MSDREKRRAEKELLSRIYPDYDPRYHDAFVIRYRKELQARAERKYRNNRGIN